MSLRSSFLLPLALGLLAGAGTVRACALDQVPSMSMNGKFAIPSPQSGGKGAYPATWAIFTFRAHPTRGQTLIFAENRSEVARSLTRQAMERPPQWRFGDGKVAHGWSVRHSYARPGTFLINVLAYDPGTRRWYPFDQATVAVRAR